MSANTDSNSTPHSDYTSLEYPPIDEELYALSGEELKFMKSQSGIQDGEALKQHIIDVQKEAYAVFPYPCIRYYAFTTLKLSRLPGYDRVLQLGKEREGAIFLDIGCCFGNDSRHVTADGFPAKQIVASDLHGEFWDLGHKLFRSTQESFPATFVAGDAFDPAHLAVAPPIYGAAPSPAPDLSTLTSLNPLRGHISVIHASSFFHLFSEEQQAHLARALAGLLSPVPGSMILGLHGSAGKKGFRPEVVGPGDAAFNMFCHSVESWTELWDGQVFEKGTVKVEAKLLPVEISAQGDIKVLHFLHWSVTRI